jgi:hypothetical protein
MRRNLSATHARREALGFEAALDAENRRKGGQHAYVARGMYSGQLVALWDAFGKERVLVLRHEDLLADPQGTMRQVWRHIGVRTDVDAEPLRAHVGSYKEHFASDVEKVEALLGWDCSSWKPDA